MQEKTVVFARKQIERERDDEIEFCPRERAQNPDGARPKPIDQHQKDDADDDAGMRDKEADKAQIGKSKGQIRSDEGLKRSTDSPKVCDLQPPPIARPKRDDDDKHRPIAQL